MRVLMLLHVILSDESLAASFTFKWPLTGVDASMPLEVSFVSEYLWAYVAFVLSRHRMHFRVLLVDFLVRKSFAALNAFIRLIARVKALVMLRQVAGLVEKLIAVDALVDAVLRDKISIGGRDLTLLRTAFAFTLFLVLQTDIWIQILLRLSQLR